MDNAQLTMLIAAITAAAGTMAAATRWAVGRVTKSIDDNSEALRAMSSAHLEYAKAMTVLSVKVDGLSDWAESHTPVEVPLPRPTGGYHVKKGG